MTDQICRQRSTGRCDQAEGQRRCVAFPVRQTIFDQDPCHYGPDRFWIRRQRGVLRTKSLMKELNLDDLVRIEKRGISLDEWMTPELLGWTSAPGERTASERTALEAVRRVARSLLCFLAPFLAWITLIFTTRRSLVFMLPLACIGLMCGDIAFSQAISAFSSHGAGALGRVDKSDSRPIPVNSKV